MLLSSGSDKSIRPHKTMKSIKAFTYAVTAAVTLAFCTFNAQARPVTLATNDIILNLALTVQTNADVDVTNIGNFTIPVGLSKFANKDLLQLLGGGNGFSTQTFSNGDQIAIAYDPPWFGDVVVVDKTGTNVLFDATKNNNDTNDTLAINIIAGNGSKYEKVNFKAGGSMTVTTYFAGSFTLLNTNGIHIIASGPSTIKFNQTLTGGAGFADNLYASWTESATFKLFGASDEAADNQGGVTINGTITVKGKGKGLNSYMVGTWFF